MADMVRDAIHAHHNREGNNMAAGKFEVGDRVQVDCPVSWFHLKAGTVDQHAGGTTYRVNFGAYGHTHFDESDLHAIAYPPQWEMDLLASQDDYSDDEVATATREARKSVAEQVREFHQTYGLGVATGVTPIPDAWQLRIDLLREEFEEYVEAAEDGNVVDVADGLADMVYVIYGTALEYGIPLDEVLAEVHRSNMSKLGADGKPVRREDGKILKGPNFSPPNIAKVINRRVA